MAKKKGKKTPNESSDDDASKTNKAGKSKKIERPYPRATLEEALKIPQAIKEKNGGNPWSPEEVANALSVSKKTPNFFYMVAASRDFGLTEGSRDAKTISLTDFGHNLVYARSQEIERDFKKKAFLNIDIFKKVLDYYKGNNLPEMKYLSNTLESVFGLTPSTHKEFINLFQKNCEYLDIGTGSSSVHDDRKYKSHISETMSVEDKQDQNIITIAEPEEDTGLKCFVVMPFTEREPSHTQGFFNEVLQSLIAPAGRLAGFTVTTAKRFGSDVIQSTIINDLLDSDLIIVDLTEHNPNVLFELGMRMAFDRPVALIRASGTQPIFDVDNMLRVYDYDSNIWPSTVKRDLPKLADHIKASYQNRELDKTYMKLLRRPPSEITI